MPDKGQIDLTSLEDGKPARVVEIRGGASVVQKLHAFGIVPGRMLKKTGRGLMKGPVVITLGTTTAAIGYGMARKIIVAPLRSSAQ